MVLTNNQRTMKQINLIKSKFGTKISTETFIVDGIDCFLHDMISSYINMKNENNKLNNNNNNIILSYEVIDIECESRYDLYDKIKQRLLVETDVNRSIKERLQILQKHADKTRKK